MEVKELDCGSHENDVPLGDDVYIADEALADECDDTPDLIGYISICSRNSRGPRFRRHHDEHTDEGLDQRCYSMVTNGCDPTSPSAHRDFSRGHTDFAV